jgi:hypothetical protein
VRLESDRRRLENEGAPPSLDEMLKELQNKTRQVHVAFIFDKSYGTCETWRILTLMLNATSKNGLNTNGDWHSFANELGLGYHQIMVCLEVLSVTVMLI